MEALRKVGKYLLLEEQEETSLGATWRAATLANGRADQFALADFINPSFAADAGFLDQYMTLSHLSGKLEHPNILRKITTTRNDQHMVSFYEYQEGFSLEKVIKRCQEDRFPFSIDHSLLVASKLLSALSYAKSKNITHGFVNPSVIFITHEGETKLKGFALSSALRKFSGGAPPLSASYQKYVPPGMSVLDANRDLLDIHAIGAILFEMLTGTVFSDCGGDPASIIANTPTAAESESIPTQIANILISALDPNAPTAYKNVEKMARDMDELLFSGEYSPTTFNLAFFMHSAFRAELEELGEKMAAERERDFALKTEERAAPPAHGSGPAPVHEPPPPVESLEKPPPTKRAPQVKSKSKGPLVAIIGIAAAVIIAGVLYMVLKSPEEAPTKFSEQEEQLKAAGRQAVELRAELEKEELRKQNEVMKQLLAEKIEEERSRKKKEIEDDLKKMELEMARLKAVKEQEQRKQEIEADLAELERRQRELLAMEKRRQDRLAKERELAAAKEVTEKTTLEEVAVSEPKTEEQDPDGPEETEVQPPEEIAAKTDTASEAVPVKPPPPRETTPAATTGSEIADKPTPPREGQLVGLDDEFLEHPILLETYQSLEVPRKAIRSGDVERNRTLSFLMKVLVNESGDVEDVQLFRNPIASAQSDYGMVEKAEKVARKLKFSSPVKLGVKVKVWAYVPINFRSK